ncbi:MULTISPECIES: sensor histidine kinase [unclassified Streptomyces]|uniref:sensor histidine kinase n=1 Tax=unclassified Streptomyces TaxID=2593676 RepID=UPI001F2FE20A|nr:MULTISPECIES: ATP-binding protein [unclassified Streptomyces]
MDVMPQNGIRSTLDGRPEDRRTPEPHPQDPPGEPRSATPVPAAAGEPLDGPDPDSGGPLDALGVDPDDLPDGLVIADEQHRVICFNAAAARITALRAADVIGLPVEQALPLEDLEGRRWWQLTDPYAGLTIRVGQPERNLLLPGGREVLVVARFVRTHPGGPVRRLVVTLRGTEARRRTERSHAELIATVAHELRSPLTSVKGFTATLLAKWERFTEDQKKVMLETVDADANRVTRLIAELLDISRIDTGRLEVRRQPVDIAAAVQRHLDAHVAAGQPADRFHLRVAGPLPALWADPDKVDQILGNLLENAVRHGEGTVTIEVAAAPGTEGDRTTEGTAVTVSDEGPGIPEESMSRVFTRFWRGSKRGGTGLGLYIVKGIVEAHGGAIAVGRAPGGGAEFRFILPVGAPAFLA